MEPKKGISLADKILLGIIFIVWLDIEFIGHFEPTQKKILKFFEPTTRIINNLTVADRH